VLIVAGAVYMPFDMVPTAVLRDQVTAVLLVPVTEAANVEDCPALAVTADGPTVTAIGCKFTVAVAVFVESATLFAVIVTVCARATIEGA
jgi:hypothetical protein